MHKKRKKLRLQNHNYSQNGMYFVTICTHDKQCFFGQIENDKMKLNAAGKIIEKQWKELENKFNITLHEYVIMPNHIHGIIEINHDIRHIVGTPLVGVCAVSKNEMAPTRGATTISDIIGAFKSYTTNEYIKKVKSGALPKFNKKIWQRSYYDHVIRKEESLQKIQEYIMINPNEWQKDELYKAL